MEKAKKAIFTFTGEHRKAKHGEHYKCHSGNSFSKWNGIETNDEYDIYTMEEIEEVWKPKEGELYHYIFFDSKAVLRIESWVGISVDRNRLELGNIFRTREAAEKKLEQIKEILKQ